jgi:ribosomal protein S18 acetylase RimI-like enzyme
MTGSWSLDANLARRLVLHEALAQRTATRELRDLGDGWLLHDRSDREPFWNRLVAPRWPVEPDAFDRRLDEVVTLFATLGRLPHIRPLPIGSQPEDLARRLLRAGFEMVGADRRMLLVDEGPCRAIVAEWRDAHGHAEERPGAAVIGADGEAADAQPDAPPEGLWVSRHPGPSSARAPDRRRWAVDASLVLAEAFGVDPLRRAALESDVMACVARTDCAILMLRIGDEPVALARRATTDDGSYLSSIGTRPAWRGRGYGALTTALVVVDALEAGSRFVHLAVDVDNTAARRLYERLGFAVVGDQAPDLLLR